VRYIALTVAALLAVPFLALSQATLKETFGRDEELEIRKLLDEQAAALKGKDVEALKSMWADDYIFVNPTGQVITKKERLRVLSSADTGIDLLSRDDVNIRIYGDAAVAISLTSAKGRVAGREIDAQFRATIVLVKSNGRWLIVSHQDNNIPRR